MNNTDRRHAGLFLLTGSILMVITMILHPVGGGGFERLIANSTFAIVSHSIAILSVPISILGFYGLYRFLGPELLMSKLAFAFIAAGLMAAAMAATLNGLAQPLFALRYQDASDEAIEALLPIFNYNMALNHAFDYILIAGMLLSVFLWSLVILKGGKMNRAIGWLGLILVGSATVLIAIGFYFLDLYGFRIFIFGWVLWIVWIAIGLVRNPVVPGS